MHEANEANQKVKEATLRSRPHGVPHFLPLTGSEGFDLYNDRDVTVG